MQFNTIHVYSELTALSVQGLQTKDKRGFTLQFEAARRLANSKHYDWENKLALQVSLRELPDVMACLLGYVEQVEFQYHGNRRDKGYRIRANTEKPGLLFELFSGSDGKFLVPALPADQFAVSALALTYFQRNYGGLSTESLLSILTSSYSHKSIL